MYCFVILFIIMAGFGFDNDDFSLSGLTQEGHDSVTVINSSSSSDDENYDGLLECALIKLISRLHIYSRSWLMAQFWQMRLSLNVILVPFRCECSVPSGQNK